MAQPFIETKTTPTSRENLVATAWHVLSTAAPVTLLTIFMIVHISHWRETGEATGLGFAIQESVLIVLFILRRRSKESLNTFSAWLAALIGSYGVLLLRPNGYETVSSQSVIMAIQLTGAALTILGSIFLGRSFGIVAANRGVKTGGVYRIVRHPIYASYLIGVVGYLIAALSIWNIAVILVTWTFHIRRIFAEESVLLRDPEYREYAARVRWRLVPFVW